MTRLVFQPFRSISQKSLRTRLDHKDIAVEFLEILLERLP